MHVDSNKTVGEKDRWELQKNATYSFWLNLGTSIPQNSRCSDIYLSSLKPFKLDEQDMIDIAWKVKTNS